MSNRREPYDGSRGTAVFERIGRRIRRWSSVGWSAARRAPVSITALAALWILAVATSSVARGPSHALDRDIGLGVVGLEHFRLWGIVTSAFWASGAASYLGLTVLILAVAVPVERRMGSARFLLAALATQIVGALIAVGLAAAAKTVDSDWGFELHIGYAVGAGGWVVGTLMVATANMDTLWRRRIRVGVLALTIVSALFGGHLIDLIRLAAAVVGLVVGPWIVGRSQRGPRIAGTRREGRMLVAIVVAASAIGPVLAALSSDAIGPLAVLRDLIRGVPWTAPEVRELCAQSAADPDCRRGLLELRLSGVGPTLLSLVPSLFVLVLSDGLRRGRRFAWWGAVASQCILLVLCAANFVFRYVDSVDEDTLFYGLADPTVYRTLMPFLTPVAVLVVLLATRRLFGVAAPRHTYRNLAGSVTAVAVGLWVVYVLGGMLARSGFDPRPSFLTLVADYPERLVPPVYLQWLDPRLLPVDVSATLLYEWIGVVFWLAVSALVAATFLRPAVEGGDPEDRDRARDLLRSGTGSPLSWMTTWSGNSYWFAPGGSGYIAYRVIAGVALTTGDPVGPPARTTEMVEGFAEFAAENGWTPCFYSVTDAVRDASDTLGWGSIQVAEETVLDLGSVAFTGKKFQDVRTALNKAKKSGITAEWVRLPDASMGITDQITAISEEWVADKGMPEMGFTLGGLDEVDDPQVRCLIAIDEDRTVHGVTSWLPVHRDGQIVGWTLDFMRRRSNGFRPAMEFLIASAASTLEDEGFEFLSLSGAPLAKMDPPTADNSAFGTMMDNLLDVLGRTLEPVYGFRSLLAFKSKFQPRYVPMYMTFPDPAALPSIGSAVGRAYLPEVSMSQSMKLLRTVVARGN